MYKIALINMPFAALHRPSLGLTQLKYVTDSIFRERVCTEIYYLNHDFAEFLSPKLYQEIATHPHHHNSALGDWLLRHIAFPTLPDNATEYFSRYYPDPGVEATRFKDVLLSIRSRLEGFLSELIATYDLEAANVVGFTSMFSQNTASFALARLLKMRNPAIITVMGGANCEAPMGNEIARQVKDIDFIFSGPALKSFPAFVDALMRGEQWKIGTINGVFTNPGTTGKLNTMPILGQPAHAPMGDELDINEPIDVEYESFLNQLERRFGREIEPVLLFESSRGCWWGERAHCTFCGLNGSTMKYRAMQPEGAITSIDSLLKYSDRCARFDSVDNIMPRDYPKTVFPKLNPPEHVVIFYEVKADLTDEALAAMARARVVLVQPGIESLATSTLQLMKKGTTAFQNITFLKRCLLHGVAPMWNLLVGFPRERDTVYQKYVQDIPKLMHLAPPTGVFPVRFDRYSPYFMRAQEYGLDLKPSDYYRMIYPFGSESLANLAYYFSDTKVLTDYRIGLVKWYGKLEAAVSRWIDAWNINGGGSPPRLWMTQESSDCIVYDSRSGGLQTIELEGAAAAILRAIENPRRIPDLIAKPGLDKTQAMNGVELLESLNLIFREDDKIMSLVCAPEANPEKTRAVGEFIQAKV
jgi:ribosomal peptide maturation radical SAM protein 1